MRCLIRIPTHTGWRTPRGRNGKRYAMERFQLTQMLETSVYRLALPGVQSATRPFVWVDAWIPENRRAGIPILDDAWIEPGVYRTRAYVEDNPKTLAPFLASGMAEIDLREITT
ncbi:protein of unknown function (plasmid) [Caballeronia sp. S22]